MDEDKDKEDEEQDDLNKEEQDALEAGRRVTKVRIIRVGSRPAFNPRANLCIQTVLTLSHSVWKSFIAHKLFRGIQQVLNADWVGTLYILILI